MFRSLAPFLVALPMLDPAAYAAQVPLDRADPAYIENLVPQPAPVTTAPPPPRTQIDAAPLAVGVGTPITADRIVVTGNQLLPAAAFEDAVQPYRGRPLDAADLRALASAIGGVARARGLPFAAATIRRDPADPRALRIELDEGRISAVRLLGATNAAADRILQGLVGDRPVTRAQLERAILLAGDVPGITIVNSRFARQDGFGILFVDARETKSSGYIQLDNRGSDEVGPLRSTYIGTVRSVAADGDQISLIAAQTPFDPKEFLFLRLRYDLPVDARGGTLAFSGSFGRTNPGASLRRLDVIGHSYDLALAYQRPLLRRRAGSLWGNLELRGTSSDQSLRGTPIRDDHFATLAGTLLGDARLAGGILRGDASVAWGLPLAGTTRPADPLASRLDGSSRFVAGHAFVEWARPIAGPVSLRLATEAQIASRPLLAAVELGAGGPLFGRAFDYGERTGDQGVLGSAEFRFDVPADSLRPVRSLQLYGFVDAGHVGNLDEGFGGGSLASAGGGIRASFAHVDFGLEAAAPLNTDRLDTGDRSPRISIRAAARF